MGETYRNGGRLARVQGAWSPSPKFCERAREVGQTGDVEDVVHRDASAPARARATLNTRQEEEQRIRVRRYRLLVADRAATDEA